MEKLEEKNYYHIYNRGINGANLFFKESDYDFFLQEYIYYSHLSLKTYAYCFMANHFHLLVKVRSINEQRALFDSYKRYLKAEENQWLPHGCDYNKFKSQLASRQFGHFFNKYAKNFNSWYNRTGKCFELPFKRKRVEDESYLTHLVCYIHRNPLHHGITDEYKSYQYSSFNNFITNSDTFLEKREVLNWFGDEEQFMKAHEAMKIKITPTLQLE